MGLTGHIRPINLKSLKKQLVKRLNYIIPNLRAKVKSGNGKIWKIVRYLPDRAAELLRIQPLQQPARTVEESSDGDQAARESDAGNGGVGADGSAEQRSAADPEIEDAGEDRHRDRRRLLLRMLDDLRLADDVERRRRHSPEAAQQDHRAGLKGGWIQQQQRPRDSAQRFGSARFRKSVETWV